MAIRVKQKVSVNIGLDTNMKNTMGTQDDTLSEVIDDGLDHARVHNFAVAAAASEMMPLEDIASVRGFHLQVDADCEVRLDGEATGHELKVPVTGGVAKMQMDAAVTQVEVVATTAVNGLFVAWGDPTA